MRDLNNHLKFFLWKEHENLLLTQKIRMVNLDQKDFYGHTETGCPRNRLHCYFYHMVLGYDGRLSTDGFNCRHLNKHWDNSYLYKQGKVKY